MRLKISRNTAEERLVDLLNEGYRLRVVLFNDYKEQVGKKAERATIMPRYRTLLNQWVGKVQSALTEIFPSPLEARQFSQHKAYQAVDFVGMDQEFGMLYHNDMPTYLDRLKDIRNSDLNRYPDLPIKDRLFVEDIDSFKNVRDVNPQMVAHCLDSDGYLSLSENDVQLALEQILTVAFHKNDWGGEINDLYTANVVINGARRTTAFLLKGPGIGRKPMTIADCGKNGDQLVRLFDTSADLFVIQYVGPIDEMVVKDVEGKVTQLRSKGKDAHYLIMDGQDTARVLYGYNKLK